MKQVQNLYSVVVVKTSKGVIYNPQGPAVDPNKTFMSNNS